MEHIKVLSVPRGMQMYIVCDICFGIWLYTQHTHNNEHNWERNPTKENDPHCQSGNMKKKSISDHKGLHLFRRECIKYLKI